MPHRISDWSRSMTRWWWRPKQSSTFCPSYTGFPRIETPCLSSPSSSNLLLHLNYRLTSRFLIPWSLVTGIEWHTTLAGGSLEGGNTPKSKTITTGRNQHHYTKRIETHTHKMLLWCILILHDQFVSNRWRISPLLVMLDWRVQVSGSCQYGYSCRKRYHGLRASMTGDRNKFAHSTLP